MVSDHRTEFRNYKICENFLFTTVTLVLNSFYRFLQVAASCLGHTKPSLQSFPLKWGYSFTVQHNYCKNYINYFCHTSYFHKTCTHCCNVDKCRASCTGFEWKILTKRLIFRISTSTVLHFSWKNHFGFQKPAGSDRNILKSVTFNLIASNLWWCMESSFNMSRCGLTTVFAANAYTAADFCASVGINGILMQLNRIRGQYLRERKKKKKDS